MRGTSGIAAAALTLLCAGASTAWAQDSQTTVVTERTPTYIKSPVRAPKQAFELGVSAGYTQPFGNISEGQPIGDVVDQGLGIGLDLGYRISPHWGVGIGGTYHESVADDRISATTNVRGATTGIHGTFHFTPYERIDPYISLGTGYRFLWRVPEGANNNLLTHGFEIAKLQVGADVRVSKDVAVGPYIAADLNRFMWNNAESTSGNARIADKATSTFLSAGIMGRFDIGGSRVRATETTYAVRTQPMYFISDVNDTERRARSMANDRTTLSIDPRIMDECGINGPKTFFDFDSADVKSDDMSTLDRVAACMTSGPLQGRRIDVVGHTDPRGTDDYNQRLGKSRAESVGDYLSGKGVSKPNISTESAGESQATGTEPHGWAWDRRVDIRLLP